MTDPSSLTYDEFQDTFGRAPDPYVDLRGSIEWNQRLLWWAKSFNRTAFDHRIPSIEEMTLYRASDTPVKLLRDGKWIDHPIDEPLPTQANHNINERPQVTPRPSQKL